MSPFWVLLLLVLLPSFLLFRQRQRRWRSPPRRRLPPGPLGFPIIGNLHQLGRLPHRSLRRLSAKHGPLMHLRLGQVPTLIVSSPDAAKQVLKTQDLAFCSRPPLTAWVKISYGRLEAAFSPYGDYWRQVRKLTVTKLLSSKHVLSSRPIREEETSILIRTISAAAAASNTPINLSNVLLSLVNNINFRLVFGRRASNDCGRSRFHDMIAETVALMGGFCAGDFFPSIPYLNTLTGMQARLDNHFREMDTFLEEEIEIASRRGGGGDSFIDLLLSLRDDPTLPLSDNHIKAILMVIFIAGSDTASVTMVWAMAEMMRNPTAMRKAQEEVIRAKGSEIEEMEYLSWVVKETFRLHPPAPLLLPRESREGCVIDGYDVAAGTWVYINVWAIGRDAEYWEEPLVFRPERFDGSTLDYRGQHFELMPFGGGRRMCPGMAQAEKTVKLVLANLLGRFEWSLPEGMTGDDIDIEEEFGLVVSKKQPLVLMATEIDQSG